MWKRIIIIFRKCVCNYFFTFVSCSTKIIYRNSPFAFALETWINMKIEMQRNIAVFIAIVKLLCWRFLQKKENSFVFFGKDFCITSAYQNGMLTFIFFVPIKLTVPVEDLGRTRWQATVCAKERGIGSNVQLRHDCWELIYLTTDSL